MSKPKKIPARAQRGTERPMVETAAPPSPRAFRKRWRWILVALAGTAVFAVVVAAVFVKTATSPAGSMIPTLGNGDRYLLETLSLHITGPRRGDVILFRHSHHPGKDFIRRVIAVAGDHIEFREDVPSVNGQPVGREPIEGPCSFMDRDGSGEVWEEHTCSAFRETLDGRSWVIYQSPAPLRPPSAFGEVTVPAGHVYVAGDNRDNSYDSRYLGSIPVSGIVGKVLWVYGRAGH